MINMLIFTQYIIYATPPLGLHLTPLTNITNPLIEPGPSVVRYRLFYLNPCIWYTHIIWIHIRTYMVSAHYFISQHIQIMYQKPCQAFPNNTRSDITTYFPPTQSHCVTTHGTPTEFYVHWSMINITNDTFLLQHPVS